MANEIYKIKVGGEEYPLRDTSKIPAEEKGVALGVASLTSQGIVPSSQLPISGIIMNGNELNPNENGFDDLGYIVTSNSEDTWFFDCGDSTGVSDATDAEGKEF